MRVSTTDPTEVAASLVFVVQSPWAGLFAPNATFSPLPGMAAAVDGDEADELVGLLEQADMRMKVGTITTEATARRRRETDNRMRAILRTGLGPIQGLP
ncbi:MAG TPA: hypothetical protein VEK76_04475 [Candidatus Binatia bacterium]|nr:hypothetical protein [Candidatus Binatia bacterium]